MPLACIAYVQTPPTHACISICPGPVQKLVLPAGSFMVKHPCIAGVASQRNTLTPSMQLQPYHETAWVRCARIVGARIASFLCRLHQACAKWYTTRAQKSLCQSWNWHASLQVHGIGSIVSQPLRLTTPARGQPQKPGPLQTCSITTAA